MDPRINPYAPGAGTPPPELAGRDAVLADARLAIQRNKAGRAARSFMFVGLRGVGKTVLLNEVQAMAEDEGALTDFIEVANNEPLSMTVIATLRSILLKLDRIKGVSEHVKRSLRVLKSFVGAVKVTVEGVEFAIDIDGEPGVADSGTLSRDLAEVFVAAGEAARARSASIVILIDEIQNLPPEEFEALIMAVHRTDQKRLPLLVVGAGLPHLVRLSGNAKTYAERLFEYPDIGALDPVEARRALVKPAAQAKVEFNDEAVAAVVRETQGYPYFLQEWGYQAWNHGAGLADHEGRHCEVERSSDRASRPQLLQVALRAVVGVAEGLSRRDGAMRSGSPRDGRDRQGHGEVVTAAGADTGGADRWRHDLQPALRVCGVHRAPLRCLHETGPSIGADETNLIFSEATLPH